MFDRKYHILIVDDNPVDRAVLKGIVTTIGSNLVITEVDSTRAAMAEIAKKSPDLILLDVYMPGQDGLSFLKQLRENKEHDDIFVLLVSSFINFEDKCKGLEWGATDFINKPIVAEDVKARVKVQLKIKEILESAKGVFRKANEGMRILYKELEQKNAKLTQMMRAVEQSPAMIMITDIDGAIQYVNPKFTQLTGYSEAEVLGKKPGILKSGVHSPEFYKDLWDTVLAGREWRGEIYNKKKNGEFFWASDSISPVKNAQGQITHFIAVNEDITERKRLEEEVRRMVAIKSEFISVVSHELRTPLGPIKEGAGVILDGLVGEITSEQRRLLTIVRNNADRLHRLIDNVLDFQKLESGRERFDVHEHAMGEVIREVAGAMALVAGKKQLELVVDCAEGIPIIRFDRDKIVQVVTNLINNAIKFTDQGTISVKAWAQGNTVCVAVEDSGCGMKEEDLPKLFEAFQQVKNLNDRKTGGTGLGLAICRQIITRHHGKIWAKSALGKGSVFSFLLPIQERRFRDV
ncbi:MAG: ATP-binding protein [Candidatus Omnitrophota bacterium]